MAKAEKAAVKKASNATPTPVKPVKQTLTKSALINLIAEENEIPRKTAAAFTRLWKTCSSDRSTHAGLANSCFPAS